MLKKCIVGLLAGIVLLLTLPFTATAETPAMELTTNGNGGKTDVGAWFITYNTRSMWGNNFGSGYPIKYRAIMSDGSYGIPASNDIPTIDFQLQMLADAKIDFVLFDLTNGGLTGEIPYGDGNEWIVFNAAITCKRIAEWNATHDWKIKYAVAVGCYAAIRGDLSIGQVTEYQAKAVWEQFYEHPLYGGEHYYQVDGKPMLIIHDWGANSLTRPDGWNSYTGDRTYGDRFFVRCGQGGEKGTYGWHTRYGTVVDEEVEVVCPGQNTAGPGAANILRNGGRYYETAWNVVLDNPSPRILMIASFNDFNEGTGIMPADTSACDPEIEEPWTNYRTGKLDANMYWNMTCEGIARLRLKNGDAFGDLKDAVSRSDYWFGVAPSTTATSAKSTAKTTVKTNRTSTKSSTVTTAISSTDPASTAVSATTTQAPSTTMAAGETNGTDSPLYLIVLLLALVGVALLCAITVIIVFIWKQKRDSE